MNKFYKQEPIKDIPKLKKVSHRKRTTFKYSSILALILIVFFSGWYSTSKFYDNNRVTFRNPLIFVLRTPILITKRFILKDLPKAEYIDVNPLTTPQNIVDTIKNHGTFDYAKSEPVDTISRETIKSLIHNKVVQKYGEEYWRDIEYIVNKESGFDPYIINKASGSCGLFQALPCTKLPSLDITDQINWFMNDYIPNRYGNPKNAYDFHKIHNWY